jgi:aldose sugar dehydrogenase
LNLTFADQGEIMPPLRRHGPKALATCALAITLALPLNSAARADLPADYTVEVLLEGLQNPWALTFLPGGDELLVTGRTGHLWHLPATGAPPRQISGLPAVDDRGQGGLLDIAIDPDFPSNSRVWLSWAGAGPGGASTHLGHAALNLSSGALEGLETVFVAQPFINSPAHFGSRIVFADGHVYLGLGDRAQKDFGPGHVSQNLGTENGAVIRLAMDGTVPQDNPFVGQRNAAGAIWSYGHRNIQAMAVNPETGDIWLAEHGERGGDEINLVRRGGNFGWPLASHGVTYRDGRAFAPPHQPGDGFVAPVFHWGPGRDDNFPPSGMTFYTGDAFPDWRGHLLIGNLGHRYLGLFQIEGETVRPPVRLLADQGWRIRDVTVGPNDGFVYGISDGPDAVLFRLVPGDGS